MADAASGYERLSGLDRSFLALETSAAHMHIGGVLLFEGGSLVNAKGELDMDRLRVYTASRLDRRPRYRQRLERSPLTRDVIWVDDARFRIERHVRHARVAAPDEHELKSLIGQLNGQPLSRERPLWELWGIDGLGGGRFALLTKTHHCMADGLAAVDLIQALLGSEPDAAIRLPASFEPRPEPGTLQLARDDLAGGLRAFESWRPRRGRYTGTGVLPGGLRRTSRTPLNRQIGPDRRVEWRDMPLDELRQLIARLGGSLNDALLAIVAGALRRYLSSHGVKVSRLDLRALVPVSERGHGPSGELGNRLGLWLVDLPIEEADPRLRHEQVCSITRELRRRDRGTDAGLIQGVTRWAPTGLLAGAARLIPLARPFNLLVTNVPGPSSPLYLADSRMLAAYPLASLFHDQALALAVFSYAGRVFWGLNADRGLVADLDLMAGSLMAARDELMDVAKSPAGSTADV